MELNSDSPASHAMRLRQVTGIPLSRCFEFLSSLGAEERERYILHYEIEGGTLLIDPVELDPTKVAAISAVKDQAKALAAAGTFGGDMGSRGRMHHWVQTELRERHAIDWKTAAEMNPHVAFD